MTEENFNKAIKINDEIRRINGKITRLKKYDKKDKWAIFIGSPSDNYILYNFDDNQEIIQDIKDTAILELEQRKEQLEKEFKGL